MGEIKQELTPVNGELTKRKPYAGKPHVQFDERSEGENPPPTLQFDKVVTFRRLHHKTITTMSIYGTIA